MDSRSSIDISATFQKYLYFVPHLLAARALSGADTTAALIGINKEMVMKVHRAGANTSVIDAFNAECRRLLRHQLS